MVKSRQQSRQRFVQVIDSCSTVAMDTRTKYGT